MDEHIKKLEERLNTATAALCSFPVQGPVTIPVGRALEAVTEAAAELRKLEEKVCGCPE